jgi:predicted nucleic acid-binding protein
MIYLDTSSLLKLLLPEPESAAARIAVMSEAKAIISPLAELETLIQLRGMWLGGELRTSEHNQLQSRLRTMREDEPFTFAEVPGATIATALRQHQASGRLHCRAFDRLHLAAMEELGVRRLMSNDENQAVAARALGFEVIIPR